MSSTIKKMLGREPSPETPPEAAQTDPSTLHPSPKSASEPASSSSSPFTEDAARAAFGGSSDTPDAFGPGLADPAGDGLVPEAVFAEAFCAGFDITAQLSGLGSLAIAEGERVAAEAAAGGLYAVARKHPSLHWLLRTDGAYVKLAVATLPFALGKVRIAAFELQARRNVGRPPSPDRETPSESA